MRPALTLTLEAQRLVRAPRARVWRAFCRQAGLPAGQTDPAPGRRLRLTLSPLGLRIRIPARVTACRPQESIAWQARWLGIRAQHHFTFSDHPQGTWIASREHLRGWTLLPLRLVYSPRRLARLTQDWLAQVAQGAEGRPRQT